MRLRAALLLTLVLGMGSLTACRGNGQQESVAESVQKSEENGGKKGADGEKASAVDTDYPQKAIQIIVPAKAGGDTDTAARLFVSHLEKELGVPVVVVNVAGASGTIGTSQVYDADPDGYTVLFFNPEAFLPKAFGVSDLGVSDFKIAGIGVFDSTLVFATRKDSPYQTVDELIQAAKENPGTIELPAMQPGGFSYANALILEKALGVDFNLTDIESNGEKIVQLLAGKIDIMGNQYGLIRDYVENGDFIPLCLMSDERNELLPEIPTLKEQGYDLGIGIDKYFFFAMPKETDQAVVDKFSAALEKVVENPEYVKAAEANYTTPLYMNSADATAYLLEAESGYKKLAELMD
ncbi:tripartite tricarboxylate transporter substrate binding protein [Clostridium sp. AM58-1XD]|uniref:tripartite tricarboxylate transporter substrate binding protein n=1 Tax=Clostridium sp. AM58-1XD TaxID=2292307 RepID=UPI000E52212A|nr:tripartite tricarboxylate transporter substrate binding protein [Clostridium sp. AM58-1XD]RGY98422.1 tripartite tricarboxylate transporter substrate binding protein [Clostridium sp. AM58-1XD]